MVAGKSYRGRKVLLWCLHTGMMDLLEQPVLVSGVTGDNAQLKYSRKFAVLLQ